MKLLVLSVAMLVALLMAQTSRGEGGVKEVRLMTLDPAHFHASLVQKFMYDQVSPVVYVYAPRGQELDEHMAKIKSFNARAENPTRWDEKVYVGDDFFQRMLQDKPGNVVVISGNNSRKAQYIPGCIDAGLNVLADKPMAIVPQEFPPLQQAFDRAAAKGVLLYDIMTERNEITNILLRELARAPEVFGTLDRGSEQDPAIVMESVHHYLKTVAGVPLKRPWWFFDVAQQGEALPDVGTHLVDLVQWTALPDQALDYKKDIQVLKARRWPTKLTPAQFKQVTGLDEYPANLKKDVADGNILNVYANGDVTWSLRGIHAKVTLLWNFEPPAGAKDTHYAMARGSKAALLIKQGKEQNYEPTLYVEKRSDASDEAFEQSLKTVVAALCSTYPGLEVKKAGACWQIVIPAKYSVGHEAHFSQVTAHYLQYLAQGKLPDWEVPNMLAKYYTTLKAYEMSHQ